MILWGKFVHLDILTGGNLKKIFFCALWSACIFYACSYNLLLSLATIVFIVITILFANRVWAKCDSHWLWTMVSAMPLLGLAVFVIIAFLGVGDSLGWRGILALGLIIIVGLWKLIDDNIKASHQKIEETKK